MKPALAATGWLVVAPELQNLLVWWHGLVARRRRWLARCRRYLRREWPLALQCWLVIYPPLMVIAGGLLILLGFMVALYLLVQMGDLLNVSARP